MKVGQKAFRWFLVISLIVLVIETIIDTQNNGDFIGYLNAGNLVLGGENIYLDFLNTWPPFFSIVSVPLALLDSASPTVVRSVWLLGNLAALFATMKMCTELFVQKKLLLPFKKPQNDSQIAFQNPVIFIPFVIMLRLFLEHSSHLQINLYMMAMAVASVYFYYKNKPVLAALFLGFSIAIKVYTVILLLYFIYKRAYKISAITVGWIVFFTSITFLVFGFETSLTYHQYWFFTASVQQTAAHHMNQSLFALVERLFVFSNTGMDLHNNIFALPLPQVKRAFYLVLVFVSLVPMYMFRKKLRADKLTKGQIIEWAIIFCAIPVLSPVAWKYYFVFLWLPFFVLYLFVYSKNQLEKGTARAWVRGLYYSSIICLVLSSELFVGVYFSDVLELYGIITIGALCLFVALFILYKDSNPQDLEHVIDETYTDKL